MRLMVGIERTLNSVLLYSFICTASCLSWVPEQGSVGASGDLAPLAHLALGILGEGKMWSPETGWSQASEVNHCIKYSIQESSNPL